MIQTLCKESHALTVRIFLSGTVNFLWTFAQSNLTFYVEARENEYVEPKVVEESNADNEVALMEKEVHEKLPSLS